MGVKLTVNQLNEAWIASGDKVTDFNDQINMALNDDNFSAEAMSELKINVIMKSSPRRIERTTC